MSNLPDDQTLQAELPEQPIMCLRDVLHLYGSLSLLESGATGEYGMYLTPNEAVELENEPQSVIAIDIDATGKEPSYEGIEALQYDSSMASALGHSYYQGRGSGIDHSLTHRSGKDKKPEKIGKYAAERLTRWPTEDAVVELAEGHTDGWLIEMLSELAEQPTPDDEEHDSVFEKVRSEVTELVGGERTSLLTVRIDQGSGYEWPGEIEVFNEGMRAQKISKLSTKNEADNATGEARCYVTGNDTDVVGTASDPMKYSLSMQQEKFPYLNPDKSWLTFPISPEAALTIEQAQDYIDACNFYALRADVYTLPYFTGTPTPEKARTLHTALTHLVDGDSDMSPMRELYQRINSISSELGEELRFYTVMLRKEQANLNTVFTEYVNATAVTPIEVAEAHREILHSSAFTGDSAPIELNENLQSTYKMLDQGMGVEAGAVFEYITNGRYFLETFEELDSTESADADDPHIRAMHAVLSGEDLAVETLLEQYVTRITDKVSERRGDAQDILRAFPESLVLRQFVQMHALMQTEITSELPTTTNYADMTQNNSKAVTDGGSTDTSTAAQRENALEQFIETYPELADDRRQGCFLLGALVGKLTQHQLRDGKSSVMLRQYPVDGLTKHTIKRAVSDAVRLNSIYSLESNHVETGMMFNELVGRLPHVFESEDPTSWDLSTDDIQYHYALGIAYAQN